MAAGGLRRPDVSPCAALVGYEQRPQGSRQGPGRESRRVQAGTRQVPVRVQRTSRQLPERVQTEFRRVHPDSVQADLAVSGARLYNTHPGAGEPSDSAAPAARAPVALVYARRDSSLYVTVRHGTARLNSKPASSSSRRGVARRRYDTARPGSGEEPQRARLHPSPLSTPLATGAEAASSARRGCRGGWRHHRALPLPPPRGPTAWTRAWTPRCA